MYQQLKKTQPLNDIFSIIYDSPIPVAVVEDEKLAGIIVRGAVIGALAGESEVNLEMLNGLLDFIPEITDCGCNRKGNRLVNRYLFLYF